MPHLVIVFDEFAEFKARYKEESKKLISIARLGRSWVFILFWPLKILKLPLTRNIAEFDL